MPGSSHTNQSILDQVQEMDLASLLPISSSVMHQHEYASAAPLNATLAMPSLPSIHPIPFNGSNAIQSLGSIVALHHRQLSMLTDKQAVMNTRQALMQHVLRQVFSRLETLQENCKQLEMEKRGLGKLVKVLAVQAWLLSKHYLAEKRVKMTNSSSVVSLAGGLERATCLIVAVLTQRALHLPMITEMSIDVLAALMQKWLTLSKKKRHQTSTVADLLILWLLYRRIHSYYEAGVKRFILGSS